MGSILAVIKSSRRTALPVLIIVLAFVATISVDNKYITTLPWIVAIFLVGAKWRSREKPGYRLFLKVLWMRCIASACAVYVGFTLNYFFHDFQIDQIAVGGLFFLKVMSPILAFGVGVLLARIASETNLSD